MSELVTKADIAAWTVIAEIMRDNPSAFTPYAAAGMATRFLEIVAALTRTPPPAAPVEPGAVERVVDHPNDECECGDYRHQHKDSIGRCIMPDDLTHGFKPCLRFRLARRVAGMLDDATRRRLFPYWFSGACPSLTEQIADLESALAAALASVPAPHVPAPDTCPHCIDERDCANAPICAAVASVPAPPGWQSIERHDGGQTEVIGMDAKGRIFKTWFFAPSSQTRKWHRCDARGATWFPLWFMPLPPPPASAAAGTPVQAPDTCPHCIDERDCANAPICAALASVPAPPVPDELRQAIGHLRTFITGMDEGNWRDMQLHAERQLDDLSKLTASVPAPPGWVLVPVEPDEAMIAEGFEAIRMEEKWPTMLDRVYRAMIAARPQT